MKRFLGFSILFSLCLPAALNAADVAPVRADRPSAPEPSPERFGWDGAYAGVQIGYGISEPSSANNRLEGVVGGAHAGYLWQRGMFVAGPEFDIDGSDLDVDVIARAKLRAGVAVDRWLVTGSIGYARAWESDAALSSGGLVFGAGVDYAVTNNVLVGADYIQHDMHSADTSRIDFKAYTLRARFGYRF